MKYVASIPDRTKLNYRNAYLSLIGIAGLVVGCIILFAPQHFYGNGSIFHEIEYKPAVIADSIIDQQIASCRQQILIWGNEMDSVAKQIARAGANEKVVLEKRKAALRVKVDSMDNIYQSYSKFRASYEYVSSSDTNAFTALDKALHFNIDLKRLAQLDSAFAQNSFETFNVGFVLKDAKLPRSEFACGTATFKIQRSDKNMDFLIKYPSVAVWVFCIMVCMAFCFVVVAYSSELESKTTALFMTMSDMGAKDETEDQAKERRKSIKNKARTNYRWISGISFFVISSLTFIWYATFNDVSIVKNFYFLGTLWQSMAIALAIGYITCALCLAGFVQTSGMLSQLSAGFTNKVQTEKAQDASKKTADLMKQYDQDNGNIFTNLLGCFNTYFVLISIVLSLTVLCTSNLFISANSLSFIKLLASDWGYSPVRYEFVYLYGALNTGIMLLVYFPAKIKFDEFEATYYRSLGEGTDNNGQSGTAVTPAKTVNMSSFLKFPYDNLKNLLVVASPFLTSLVNTLFDLVFNQ